MQVQFERESLYREIWADPMTVVSKRYGLSDNGLRISCRALQIPMPTRGYWARIRAGQHPKIPSLPKIDGPTTTLSTPVPKPAQTTELDAINAWLKEKILFEADPAHRISVDTKISEDAVLPRTKGSQMRRRASLPSTEIRELRIWRAVWNAAIERGFKPYNSPGKDALEFDGIVVRFRISEATKKVPKRRHEITAIDKFTGHHTMDEPTGVLRFFVCDSYNERKISDAPGKPLEKQLNAIICRAYKIVASGQIERMERIEKDRLNEIRRLNHEQALNNRAERIRLELAEKERQDGLLAEALRWNQAGVLRQYVNHIASSGPSNSELETWLMWARSVADKLDPTAERINGFTCPKPGS